MISHEFRFPAESIINQGLNHQFSIFNFQLSVVIWIGVRESRKGRMADALALTGDEGRDKLR